MSNELTINFNDKDYIATYNEQTGYYEVNLQAPKIGGIYEADINFTDLYGQEYKDTQVIQVFAREKVKLDTTKVFMWIFDYYDFTIKDIVEISDYDINIDEETNANTIIKVLKKTTAKAKDIIFIKRNAEIIYWGRIENISNDDGKILNEYTIKYITNMFDEKVPLYQNVSGSNIEKGYYRIKTVLASNKVLDVENKSTESGANIQIYDRDSTQSEKWEISKGTDGYYTIKNSKSSKVLTVQNSNFVNDTNVVQQELNNSDAQKWTIEKFNGSRYKIKTKTNNLYLTVNMGSTENGTIIKIHEAVQDYNKQTFTLEITDEEIIRDTGIEDQIAKAINDNFVNNEDTFINKTYLEVRVKTHTKLQTSVSNVDNGLYNLHTWMTNCTQLYNINYDIYIENKKLIIEIENKSLSRKIIDVKAQAISKYTEVFETDIVAKVIVTTSTDTYELYLLNDRTTTRNMNDPNRAEGRTERIYTENYEDAMQTALDAIKSNSYNHMISFNMLSDEMLKIGTPIAIKTRESVILDTYISAVRITQNKFVEYTCGNIRIKFIDKLLKERKK